MSEEKRAKIDQACRLREQRELELYTAVEAYVHARRYVEQGLGPSLGLGRTDAPLGRRARRAIAAHGLLGRRSAALIAARAAHEAADADARASMAAYLGAED